MSRSRHSSCMFLSRLSNNWTFTMFSLRYRLFRIYQKGHAKITFITIKRMDKKPVSLCITPRLHPFNSCDPSGITHNLGVTQIKSDQLYFGKLFFFSSSFFYESGAQKELICLISPGAHISRHLENQILYNLLWLANVAEEASVRISRDAVI